MVDRGGVGPALLDAPVEFLVLQLAVGEEPQQVLMVPAAHLVRGLPCELHDPEEELQLGVASEFPRASFMLGEKAASTSFWTSSSQTASLHSASRSESELPKMGRPVCGS